MISLLVALLVSPVYAEMTSEQVVKQFSEPGHIPQNLKPRKYHKLEEVLPSAQRKKMEAEYSKKKDEPHSSPSSQPSGKPEASFKLFKEVQAAGKSVPPVSPVPTPTASGYPKLPSSVDFRKFDTPIRNQWDGTCTAHGLIASMENILNRSNPSQTVLSTRYFWNQYQQYSAYSAINAATKRKQVLDKYWPQNSVAATVNDVAKFEKYKMTSSDYLDSNVNDAVKALAAGHPVYIAMAVPADMASCRATIRTTTKVTNGGHALSVVGYVLAESISGGGYFILKNSWGTDCGDKGYQYLPFGVCDRTDIYCTFWSIEGAA